MTGTGTTTTGGMSGTASGATSSAGATGGFAEGGAGNAGSGAVDTGGMGADQPPWRDLNITAPPAALMHGGAAGVTCAGLDTRSAKMAGKLVVDLGVQSGGCSGFLMKRGFHSMGVTQGDCPNIDNWGLGRDYDGNCRLNTLDGMPHGNQSAVTPAHSIMNQVLSTLQMLEHNYPTEGWGYFLTQDLHGVRWSDVAFTGISHGAQSAICFGTELRLYRAVARSGPRDNTCGTGAAAGPYDPNHPPYDPNCPIGHIASWIDSPVVTPIDRFFAFVGMQDGQYGDDLFTMQRMNWAGMPVDVTKAQSPFDGTHRFLISTQGHFDFLAAAPAGSPWIPALNIAFGVLSENESPNF
jgi:hypothetical protein